MKVHKAKYKAGALVWFKPSTNQLPIMGLIVAVRYEAGLREFWYDIDPVGKLRVNALPEELVVAEYNV